LVYSACAARQAIPPPQRLAGDVDTMRRFRRTAEADVPDTESPHPAAIDDVETALSRLRRTGADPVRKLALFDAAHVAVARIAASLHRIQPA
jgi:hypothetical protein